MISPVVVVVVTVVEDPFETETTIGTTGCSITTVVIEVLVTVGTTTTPIEV
jgi:hypothetical protein